MDNSEELKNLCEPIQKWLFEKYGDSSHCIKIHHSGFSLTKAIMSSCELKITSE